MLDTGLRNKQSAEDYDRYTATATQPWDALFVERCAALRPRESGGSLSDVGAGTGVLLEKLSQHPGFATWHLSGIEHFDDMVQAANERLGKVAPRITVQLGDAARLPYADGSLDLVVSRATIHHLPDQVAALREMHRVLKPGGVGMIHDVRRDMPEKVLTAFNKMRAAVGYGPTTLEEKLTPAEMAALLERASLSQTSSIHTSSEGVGAIGFEVVIRKA